MPVIPMKDPSEGQIQHHELKLEAIVFNHTPKLGDPPKQGDVDGERKQVQHDGSGVR
jgi:hypothetical protein